MGYHKLALIIKHYKHFVDANQSGSQLKRGPEADTDRLGLVGLRFHDELSDSARRSSGLCSGECIFWLWRQRW